MLDHDHDAAGVDQAFSCSISLSTSAGCRPVLGSSIVQIVSRRCARRSSVDQFDALRLSSGDFGRRLAQYLGKLHAAPAATTPHALREMTASRKAQPPAPPGHGTLNP